MNSLIPLIGMTLGQLQQVAAECGMPRFAAGCTKNEPLT